MDGAAVLDPSLMYRTKKTFGEHFCPLFFNIDLIDLFYECEESNIASDANGTTPYSCARDTETVISESKSLTNVFTGSGIIILRPILENVIYF